MPTRDDTDRDREDLVERLDELDTRLRELRDELVADRRRQFRPPTPRELLRFTEEYTIPTVIAVLEANIRALRLLQRGLRLADSERTLREEGSRAGERGAVATREAADRLARALDELGTALTETELPSDPEARSILEDVRDVRTEIAERLRESAREDPNRHLDEFAESSEGPVTIPVEDGDTEGGAGDATSEGADADADDENDVGVDVEAELESIKEEMGESDGEGEDEEDAESEDEGDGADDEGEDEGDADDR